MFLIGLTISVFIICLSTHLPRQFCYLMSQSCQPVLCSELKIHFFPETPCTYLQRTCRGFEYLRTKRAKIFLVQPAYFQPGRRNSAGALKKMCDFCALIKLAPQVILCAKRRCNTWGAKERCNSAAKNHPSARPCLCRITFICPP